MTSVTPQPLCESACPVIVTDPHMVAVQPQSDAAGHRIRFHASAGLHQLTVIADGSAFDWDLLYVTLNEFHNTNRRTGPWDFDPTRANQPLVPTYRVTLDGKRLGTWFFQRVSLDDLAHKRFRGRMAMMLTGDGAHELLLQPLVNMPIRWTTATLEPDPEDRLQPLPANLRPATEASPFRQWQDPSFWAAQRQRLAASPPIVPIRLDAAFDWALQTTRKPTADDIPILIAAHHLLAKPGALDRALACLDRFIDAPTWGNSNPDGYSHNGDMGAMMLLRTLAWAYHMLGQSMGAPRLGRLLRKVRLQGDIFLDLALLNRDYWGGSVLQDHGWRSMWGFGTAALNLLGVIDEARTWLQWLLPRLQRALDAMPRDGAIPETSYISPWLYLDEPTHFRDTLLAMTGDDLFDRGPWRPIVDFLLQALRPQDQTLVSTAEKHDQAKLLGGEVFLHRMVEKHQPPAAVAILALMWQRQPGHFYHGDEERGYYSGKVWGFLSGAGDAAATPHDATLPRPKVHLAHFPDMGLAHYRHDDRDLFLSLRCGPFAGHHAYVHATGPCDRLAGVPGAGHFAIVLQGVPLLATPEAGYQLRSHQRSILLVDDRGQIGDVGYPMSIPSALHPGHHIQSVHWDSQTGCGTIQMDLRPAYPADLDMAQYTRTIAIHSDGRILCRDHVVFDSPHRLAWLFHGRQDRGLQMIAPLRAQFGTQPALTLEPSASTVDLQADIRPTDLVWSYSSPNHFQPFVHVRYQTTAPAAHATVAFSFTHG